MPPGGAGLRRTAVSDALSLFAPRRGEKSFFALCFSIMGVAAILPASVLVQGGALVGGDGDAAIDAAKIAVWAGLTALMVRQYMRGIRLRRLKAIVDYAGGLFRSLPDRTEIECLAVLHEIQNRYAEADKYLAKVNDEEITRGIEEIRSNIKINYRIRICRTRYAKGDADEFARAMETLGRDRGGGLAHPGR